VPYEQRYCDLVLKNIVVIIITMPSRKKVKLLKFSCVVLS